MSAFVTDEDMVTLRSLLEGAMAEMDAGSLNESEILSEILEVVGEWADEVAEDVSAAASEHGQELERDYLLDEGRGIALVPAERYMREIRVEQALDDIGLRVVQWWQLSCDDIAENDNLADGTAVLELHLSDLHELADAQRRARAFP